MSEKLEPCPNPWCCAKTAPVLVVHSPRARVACACGVQTFWMPTSGEAIAAWNRRAARAEARPAPVVGRAEKYDARQAKRDFAAGDPSGLIELAELAEYERKKARTWHLIAKAMGYESGGRWDEPSDELSELVRGQIVKSRARVRTANLPAAAVDREAVARVVAVCEAAQVYYERYCQDEAADDGPDFTGCSEQQHLDAQHLRDALAEYSRDEILALLSPTAEAAPSRDDAGGGG